MHRIFKVSWIIALIFGVFFAFQAFIVMDQNQPYGTQSSFTVEQISGKKSAALTTFKNLAQEEKINIYKIQPDPESASDKSIAFVFIGNQAAFARAGGYSYPTFSSLSGRYTIKPASAITYQDLRGQYAVNVSGSKFSQLVHKLSEQGMSISTAGSSYKSNAAAYFIFGIGQSNSAAFFLALILALILSIAFSCSRQRKSYALRELHGYSHGQIVRGEIADFLAFSGKSMIIVLALLTLVLGIYNHFHQYFRFLSLLCISWLALLILGITAVSFISSIFIRSIAIVPVIKNQNNTTASFVIGFATQIIVVALIFGALSGTVLRISAVNQASNELTVWQKTGPLYSTSIYVNLPQEKMFDDGAPFRQVAGSLESKDQTVFIHSNAQDSEAIAYGERSYFPGEKNSLYINNGYLQKNPILDVHGHKITYPTGELNKVLLIVPETYHGSIEKLKKSYASDLKGWCETSESGSDSPSNKAACKPELSIIRAKAGQSYFLYNNAQLDMPAEGQSGTTSRTASLKDPVAAVANVRSHLIAPAVFISYASSGNVLFTNPAALTAALDKAGILGDFSGINNAADIVAYSIQLSQREQVMDILGMILGFGVFVMSIGVLISAYCELRKKQNFIKLTHGYSFIRRHVGIILVGFVVTVAALEIASRIGHMRDGASIVLALIILILQVSMTVGMLKTFESQTRASMIKES